MKGLTEKQRAVYDWIAAYIRNNGYAPTYAEIARAFGWKNQSTVWEYMTALDRKGYIDMCVGSGSPRKLRLK